MTSLTSDKLVGHVIITGCGDGGIRFYDRRNSAQDGAVLQFKEHSTWIVGVHLQNGSGRQLVSGWYLTSCCIVSYYLFLYEIKFSFGSLSLNSADGYVKFWDSRFPTSVTTIEADNTSRMSSIALHDHVPIFAVYVKI